MDTQLLVYLLIFLGSAVLMVPICQRLGLGSVLGYLLAGILIGPHGLGLYHDVDVVQHISELGIVLMLFVIGLDLVPKRLWDARAKVFGVGGAQVVLTAIVLAQLAHWNGWNVSTAVVIGAGLAMSSTAMALQLLSERNELASAQGRTGFAVLLFQDLAVIPLMAFIPLLAGQDQGSASYGHWLLAFAAVAALLLLGRPVLNRVFRIIGSRHNRELFTATALFLVLGVAVLMQMVGLSMALGAFLAGILLADSEFQHQLQSDIEPFKGLLLGLFFISVGMGINTATIVSQPLEVAGIVLLLVAVKLTVLWLIGRVSGLDSRQSRSFAIVLSQGGEFAYVLFALAAGRGLIDAPTHSLLGLSVGLSMATTPLLFLINDRYLEPRLKKPEAAPKKFDAMPEKPAPVIIAGFGRFAQIVGRVLSLQGIRFTAIDRDPQHIHFIGRFGIKVYFGDVTRMDLLQSAGIDKAQLFVLSMADPEVSLRVARMVRSQWPNVKIYARANSRMHAYQLINLGCHFVVRDSFHSSLNMTESLLRDLGVPDGAASETVRTFRDHDEKLLGDAARLSDNMDRLVEFNRRGRAELEELFHKDR